MNPLRLSKTDIILTVISFAVEVTLLAWFIKKRVLDY